MGLRHWETVLPKDIRIICVRSNLQIDCWADVFQDRAENHSLSRPLRRICNRNEPIHSGTSHGQANHNRAWNGISPECVQCGSLNMMTSVMDDHFHAVHRLPDIMNALLCHTTLNSVIHWGGGSGQGLFLNVFKILTAKCISCLAEQSQNCKSRQPSLCYTLKY